LLTKVRTRQGTGGRGRGDCGGAGGGRRRRATVSLEQRLALFHLSRLALADFFYLRILFTPSLRTKAFDVNDVERLTLTSSSPVDESYKVQSTNPAAGSALST
jgi:hypothetical protein